jgi:D-alanine-D-alanine ligase
MNASKKKADKPPDQPFKAPGPWLVAVIANLKGAHHEAKTHTGPEDADAEYDKPETIQSIRTAIESDGHKTVFINADAHLPYALQDVKPQICFNIAEGKGADSREAHVPALLALLGIPYTASQILPNAVSLDKPLTKRIWRDARLPVCPFQVFVTGDEPLQKDLTFPMFVKPAREGTGMGVDLGARVQNEAELRKRVAWVIETYRQPALVENFLPGREFTVGVLGRADAKHFARCPAIYAADGFHRFPLLEIESKRSITPDIYSHHAKSIDIGEAGAPGYLCPAEVEPRLEKKLQNLAIQAHNAIGAADISRVDFRLDKDGRPMLLEINTLPGLNPAISDVCIMSDAENLPYHDVILEILYLAASRYGLMSPVR